MRIIKINSKLRRYTNDTYTNNTNNQVSIYLSIYLVIIYHPSVIYLSIFQSILESYIVHSYLLGHKDIMNNLQKKEKPHIKYCVSTVHGIRNFYQNTNSKELLLMEISKCFLSNSWVREEIIKILDFWHKFKNEHIIFSMQLKLYSEKMYNM